jgi:hypothetical protein
MSTAVLVTTQSLQQVAVEKMSDEQMFLGSPKIRIFSIMINSNKLEEINLRI